MVCNPEKPVASLGEPINEKMLLVTAVINHLQVQGEEYPTNEPRKLFNSTENPSLAPAIAKILANNPKFMVELAIELTKLTQQGISVRPITFA
jgi:hypothetical protein